MGKIEYKKEYDYKNLKITAYDQKYNDIIEYNTPNYPYILKRNYNKRIIDFLNLNIEDYSNILIEEA